MKILDRHTKGQSDEESAAKAAEARDKYGVVAGKASPSAAAAAAHGGASKTGWFIIIQNVT